MGSVIYGHISKKKEWLKPHILYTDALNITNAKMHTSNIKKPEFRMNIRKNFLTVRAVRQRNDWLQCSHAGQLLVRSVSIWVPALSKGVGVDGPRSSFQLNFSMIGFNTPNMSLTKIFAYTSEAAYLRSATVSSGMSFRCRIAERWCQMGTLKVIDSDPHPLPKQETQWLAIKSLFKIFHIFKIPFYSLSSQITPTRNPLHWMCI